MSIYKERGSDICTDVYSKPTDTHRSVLIDSMSCHPRDVKEAIPHGQAL